MINNVTLKQNRSKKNGCVTFSRNSPFPENSSLFSEKGVFQEIFFREIVRQPKKHSIQICDRNLLKKQNISI